MIDVLKQQVQEYSNWLMSHIKTRSIDSNWGAIEVPFFDRHNDALQIYVRQTNDGFDLTDDGYIIQDLQDSGCDIHTEHRMQLLQETVNGYSIAVQSDDALFVHTTAERFRQRMHDLILSMLAVNDLYYLTTHHVKSVFFDDVITWFDEKDIRFSTQVRIEGKSGIDHRIPMLIPHSKKAPERFIHTTNTLTIDRAKDIIFSLEDIREVRDIPQAAYVFIYEGMKQKTSSSDALEALNRYHIRPVFWEERQIVLDDLVA